MTRITQTRIAGVMILLLFTTLSSCKKNKPSGPAEPSGALPTLTTKPVVLSTAGYVESGGIISDDGDLPITERGICWSVNPAPTIADQKAPAVSATDNYKALATGLVTVTKYYFRAYATNSKGTAYGNEVSYTALKETMQLKAIWWGEAVTTEGLLNGIKITPSGLGFSTLKSMGICWSLKTNPTISDSIRSVSKMEYDLILHTTVLTAKTRYYVRAFAINKTDTVYSNEVSFETPLAVGYLHAGGIILTVNAAKTGGTVVSVHDLDPLPWAPVNMSNVATGATSDSDGASNTAKIIAAFGTDKAYAAKACRDYRGGGFSDWYLPAKKEMEELRKHTAGIRISAKIFRNGSANCWSSTEVSAASALEQDFNLPTQTQWEKPKTEVKKIFAVRAFGN